MAQPIHKKSHGGTSMEDITIERRFGKYESFDSDLDRRNKDGSFERNLVGLSIYQSWSYVEGGFVSLRIEFHLDRSDQEKNEQTFTWWQ